MFFLQRYNIFFKYAIYNLNKYNILSNPHTKTVEHIFPQQPSKEWAGKLGQGNKLENYVNKIGNLMVLPSELNSQCGNKEFREKAKIYKISLLHIANDVILKDYINNQEDYIQDWGKDEIESRTKKLINIAKDIWK